MPGAEHHHPDHHPRQHPCHPVRHQVPAPQHRLKLLYRVPGPCRSYGKRRELAVLETTRYLESDLCI